MCGRFVASRPVADITRLLEVEQVEVPAELLVPRWNVAPQASILAVTVPRQDVGLRRLSAFRWGLVPWWAKDPSIGARAFNAKAETVGQKPMFRGAIERQRCIVPVDAFYEWAPPVNTDATRRKQPWCFRPRERSGLLFLGGLWEQWRPRDAKSSSPLYSCTIITTQANDLVGRIHDRMPLLIAEEDLEEWLRPQPLEPTELGRLIRPAASEALETFKVSTRLNDAREQGPDLAEPVASDEADPGDDDDETELHGNAKLF
jgi:putative SOS response-associated peptidase YedK